MRQTKHLHLNVLMESITTEMVMPIIQKMMVASQLLTTANVVPVEISYDPPRLRNEQEVTVNTSRGLLKVLALAVGKVAQSSSSVTY